MTTKEVGQKLVEFCKQGKHVEAIDALYSPDIVSVEAIGNPEMPAEQRGIEAIRGKNSWWIENHEVHESQTEGPFPHNERFAVKFHYAMTPKTGPMQGKRMNLDEIGLYTVENGKIVREEFFYDM